MSQYHSYIAIENLADHIGKEVTLNGWVSDRTDKGKLCFIKLRDGSGIVQCVAFRPTIGDELFE
ncbi:MAG: OB-fold nucleic acid binding domain-containing protein, partial [Bacteroidota bacterium]